MSDALTAAVAANITAEVEAALAFGEFKDATAIGLAAWADLTPNAAGIRIARLCKGKHLRLGHIPPLAAALGIKCDDLTSTETDAARAALEETT